MEQKIKKDNAYEITFKLPEKMNKDIEVKKEKYFHSKGNNGRAYDMARITIELPITAWRAMKGKIYGDELISHQRRFTDIKKEVGIKCNSCSKDDILLRERIKKVQTGQGEVKYKFIFYKCNRCNSEFNTDMLVQENERRMLSVMNKKIKK